MQVEIRIKTATFLVDRLYSSTYVRDSADDSHDLILAVDLARTAVVVTGEQMHEEEEGAAGLAVTGGVDMAAAGGDEEAAGERGQPEA